MQCVPVCVCLCVCVRVCKLYTINLHNGGALMFSQKVVLNLHPLEKLVSMCKCTVVVLFTSRALIQAAGGLYGPVFQKLLNTQQHVLV